MTTRCSAPFRRRSHPPTRLMPRHGVGLGAFLAMAPEQTVDPDVDPAAVIGENKGKREATIRILPCASESFGIV
jgi:hypothetical protein